MKKHNYLKWILLSLAAFVFSTCSDGDSFTIPDSEPILVPRSEIMPEADFTTPISISRAGKLYYKDNYLFISEIDSGIHVINNEDPANPTITGFITLPGNKDLAAKGDYLYADSYFDLVVLDISDKTNITEINREDNVFRNVIVNNQWYSPDDSGENIIIGYRQIEREVGFKEYQEYLESQEYEEYTTDTITLDNAGAGAGTGGSLARFTISENHLYTVSNYDMTVFDISTGDNPEKGNTIPLGWGIETIFPYNDLLFLGAQNGMHIYDNSVPTSPNHLSTYEHIQSCDPVVVNNDIAYVTLRSGSACFNQIDRLDVIDVSNPRVPKEIASYEMQNPHGLGVIDNCLFIAEGEHGLKLFSIEDPLKIDQNLIKHHKDIHALDVIPLPDVLMMIGEDGLVQYEYDCNEKLEQISILGL